MIETLTVWPWLSGSSGIAGSIMIQQDVGYLRARNCFCLHSVRIRSPENPITGIINSELPPCTVPRDGKERRAFDTSTKAKSGQTIQRFLYNLSHKIDVSAFHHFKNQFKGLACFADIRLPKWTRGPNKPNDEFIQGLRFKAATAMTT
jgi:hypothetical protein